MNSTQSSFFDVVERRRSVRRFKPEPVPTDVIEKALEAAILAPNSSNTQTWDFYWLQSPEAKKKGVEICLSQSAARTAADLIVVVADPGLWRRSQKELIQWVERIQGPPSVKTYYEKLIPFVYRWGFLNCLAPIKMLISFSVGLFRPMMRGLSTRRDIQEVAIKSAALAAENFVLAISAQGYDSCMMEGFDEARMKSFLKLPGRARVVMVIGVGAGAEKGTWGPRFRLPLDQVVHRL